MYMKSEPCITRLGGRALWGIVHLFNRECYLRECYLRTENSGFIFRP